MATVRVFEPIAAPSHAGVRIAGKRVSVPIRHVSRETLNRPMKIGALAHATRELRRDRRKARMRLRKRRGWR